MVAANCCIPAAMALLLGGYGMDNSQTILFGLAYRSVALVQAARRG